MRTVVSIVLNNFLNDSRVLKEAVSLKNTSMFDVRVVALHYKGLNEYEEINGLKVHRLKLKTMKWGKGMISSLIKYTEFIFKGIKISKSADIIHCNDLNTLPVGVLTKMFFKRKIKVVYDAHEFETEQEDRPNALKYKFSVFLERWLIKRIDLMITVGEGISLEYAKRYKIKKPEVIMNCPQKFETVNGYNLFRGKFNISSQTKILLYQGGLSGGRGIELILEAFIKFNPEDLALVFMGYGPLVEVIKKAAESNRNIFYHEAVSPDQLLKYTSSADFGLLFYEAGCLNNYYCMPNKYFEYIMAEVPVLTAPLYEIKRITEEAGIGLVALENTVDEIINVFEKVRYLNKHLFNKNLIQAKLHYVWNLQEEKLINLYKQL